MELKVDKFGRVVIPMEIRGKLGLEVGSKLLIKEEKGSIHLAPVKIDESNPFKRKNNILVFSGKMDHKKSAKDWEDKWKADRNQSNWGLS